MLGYAEDHEAELSEGVITAEQVADTVVARVLDHLGVENEASPRWQEEE